MLFKLNGLHNSYAVLRVRLKAKRDCKACEKEGDVKVCGSHFNQLFPAGFATESPFLFICLFNLVAEKLMLLL